MRDTWWCFTSTHFRVKLLLTLGLVKRLFCGILFDFVQPKNNMKAPLFLIFAASATFVSCSNSSYPGSSNYPGRGSTQYPYPQQYPYPGTNEYPYPSYPSDGRRNNDVIVTRDGRVIDRNGRVVGTTRNLPPGQAKKIYGSRNDRRYEDEQRRRDERRDNNRYNNDRYEKEHENGKQDDNRKWNNKHSDRDND